MNELILVIAPLVSLLIWVVVFVALGVTRKAGQLPVVLPVLVLRRFRIKDAPSDGNFVEISGRPSGLVSWVLRMLKVDDETRLVVTATHISIRQASLWGQVHKVITLPDVNGMVCGYRRPLGFLALGLAILLSSLWNALLFGLTADNAVSGLLLSIAFAVVMFVAYVLGKKMVIAVGDIPGRNLIGITFKASVIEGVAVDIDRAQHAIALINRRVLEAQLSPQTVAPLIDQAITPASQGRRVRPNPRVAACASCGASLPPDGNFCEECGEVVRP